MTKLFTTSMADIRSKKLFWVWPNRIPRGKLSLLCGEPDAGKSILTGEMAAHISTGAVWPDGRECKLGRVLFICAEDDPGDTIKPRLKALGADMNRIEFLNPDEVGDVESQESVPFDISQTEALRQVLTETQYRLVIIDPLSAFMPPTNRRNGKNLRRVLGELADVAQKTRTAILLVTHLAKNGSGSAVSRIMGNLSVPAACRSAFLLAKDAPTRNLRLLISVKQNLVRRSQTLALEIIKRRIIWRGTSDITIDDYSFRNTNTQRRGENRDVATQFLLDALKDGPVRTSKIKAMAKAAGLSFSGAVRRASNELGIRKKANQFGESFWWSLSSAHE